MARCRAAAFGVFVFLVATLSICNLLRAPPCRAFSTTPANRPAASVSRTRSGTSAFFAGEGGDPSEVVAKRITVKGDVQGGYYRSCVKNEVRCFQDSRTWGSFIIFSRGVSKPVSR